MTSRSDRPAVALDAAPRTEELLAAKAEGLSLVAWREKHRRTETGRVTFANTMEPVFLGALQMAVSFSVPWSCLRSINGTWTIRTKEYQGAKRRAQQKIGEQLPAGWLPLTARLAVDVILVVPDHRPRDLDNYRKLLFDSMKGLVYRDDSLIDDDRMRRQIDCDRPRAEITVTPLGAQP